LAQLQDGRRHLVRRERLEAGRARRGVAQRRSGRQRGRCVVAEHEGARPLGGRHLRLGAWRLVRPRDCGGGGWWEEGGGRGLDMVIEPEIADTRLIGTGAGSLIDLRL
jgi:hypothetical protein